MMYRKNLEIAFAQYEKRFDELNNPTPHNEGFKWEAFSCFAKHWDIEAKDFLAMFKAAIKQTSVLLGGAQSFPASGVETLLKAGEVDFVRQCFRNLFAEDGGDLDARQARMQDFMDQMNTRIQKYKNPVNGYEQTWRSTICYLSMWRPAENYLYKYATAKHWANCIEFADDFGSGKSFSLKTYYRMCEELLQAVRANTAIMARNAERLAQKAIGYDDMEHILVYDVMYCTHKHALCMALPFTATERIYVANLRNTIENSQQKQEALQLEIQQLEQAVNAEDLIGVPVRHRSLNPYKDSGYGEGIVVALQEQIIMVSFGEVTIRFAYPQSLQQGSLQITDEDARQRFQRALDAQEELARKEAEQHILSQFINACNTTLGGVIAAAWQKLKNKNTTLEDLEEEAD